MKALRLTLLLALLIQALPGSLPALDREIHGARRKALLEKLAGSAAIVPGSVESDLEEFRQSNNFFYLTGVEQPNLILLLAPGARSPQTLFLPARNPDQGYNSEAWTGKKLGPGKETEELTGIPATLERGNFENILAGLAPGLDRLYFDYQTGTLDGPVSAAEVLLKRIIERYPHLEIMPLARLVDSLRVVKDSTEVMLIQRAIEITGKALEETIRRIEPGMYEYEVEASIEYGFHRRGSQCPGFPSIVGSGPNTTVLHYNENRRKIGKGDLVLMDVGAELDRYTADITRTVPADGHFSARQKEIYQIVLDAGKAATAAIRPGVTLRDVHKAAWDYIYKAGYSKYFIHYTSHFLGLDVHDVGGRDQALAPGMVITVEPGIYIPEEKLGVRIEDDVLVTEDGSRVLSSDIPKEIKEIEKLMSGK